MMRTLIVVPTYNEVENIQPLVEAILASTPSSVDVLIVDDSSPDGTGALADILAVRHEPRVHVLHREKKMGLGTAYVNGFRWGMAKPEYQVFIEMDADFSHNPSYLKTMLSQMETADVAIGSRYVEGGGTKNWGLGRKILSRGGSIYSRLILGAPIRDFTGGFNGWRRAVLDSVEIASLRSDGYSFQIELKYRAFLRGFRIVEFPILFEDRKVGASKMHRRIVLEALKRVWSFRWNSRKFLTGSAHAH
jgi:dolichol-phosphate mannosyltransferase